MTTGQNTVAINMAAGVVGEIAYDGPTRAQPGVIDTDGVTNPNRVGRVFTQGSSDGHCGVGGTGVFYGILANPKVYPLYGTAAGGALAASLDLPRYAAAEFVYDTTGIFVSLPAAANVGDEALFDTTTGAISTQPGSAPVSGAQRVAFASTGGVTTATVSAVPAGFPPIGVGSVLTAADGKVATVTALGSGTGGNGTYITGTVADASAQAFALSKPGLPSGKARIPGFVVVRNSIPSAGLAVIGNVN